MKQGEKHELSYMVLTYEDVVSAIGKERANKLTPDEVERLREEMSEQLAQDWDTLIRDIISGWWLSREHHCTECGKTIDDNDHVDGICELCRQ